MTSDSISWREVTVLHTVAWDLDAHVTVFALSVEIIFQQTVTSHPHAHASWLQY